MSVTTLVLADDHHVVRQGLRALLEAEPDFSILGEAADGLEVAGVVERLKPDVLVLDLMMPGLNGLDVVRQVRQRSPHTRVVILSMHSNECVRPGSAEEWRGRLCAQRVARRGPRRAPDGSHGQHVAHALAGGGGARARGAAG